MEARTLQNNFLGLALLDLRNGDGDFVSVLPYARADVDLPQLLVRGWWLLWDPHDIDVPMALVRLELSVVTDPPLVVALHEMQVPNVCQDARCQVMGHSKT